MNALKQWVLSSRIEERRRPERYLKYYPELKCDENYVYMTQETLDKIERNCGRYDGTLPTGEYLGKMFLRGGSLFWIGISKERPMSHIAWNSRKIVVI